MFTPRIINNYYGITTADIHPLPSIQDMGEVARFLYGRDDAWPLPERDFEHSKLTDSLLILNISPAEPVLKAKGPINRYALENARRHTARAVGAVPDAQDQPPEEHAAAPQLVAPQPAAPPADITSMLRQILECQAEHTRLIVAIRTEMRTMQQELATLRARVDILRHAQMNQESRQRNIDIEQRRIRADCDEVKRHLDRCAGQLDDIHDKLCRPAPTLSQDPSPVDPTTLFLPAPTDPHPGSV
ncbi:Uncharacterized protein Adt_21346 [Abeliophyllum distichum]|uniref:Uncharacterized protein n=1 Tax=Abeliophyllum distichum TaxID=126358 RepID=A0ABD1SZ31_9LAMI